MPTYLSTRFSRPMALLVALAMVAGLLVVTPSAGRAQSNDPMPDYVATFDACPEDVIPDADFSDVSSRHENVSDIDCIAYYGITRGVGNNRYAPDDPVIREHMALFLIRMAKLVGIDVPAAGSTPFRDIVDLDNESQEAIGQLAQLGITRGTSDTTYSPARNVSRGEMALFLKRLMNLIDVPEHRGEVFGYLPADVEDDVLEDADVDTPYNDMGQRTVEEFVAVEELYELGVASGVSSRAYGPARDMSRSHMAEFMAAILDHSNLRPGGVTVQLTPTLGWESYTVTAMISARTSDFQPRDDERVDWFYTADPDGGLQSNGMCDLDLIIEGDCVWDDDRDDLTDDFGNYYETFNAEAGQVVTFYAWMGNRDGEEFDEDGAGGFGAAEARSDTGPETFDITSNIPEHAATYDSDDELDGAFVVNRDSQRSIRMTIQLEDDEGKALDREDLEIAVVIEEFRGSVTNDTSNFPEVTWQRSRTVRRDEETIRTDRRGEATFQLNRPTADGATLVTLSYLDLEDTFAVLWSDAPSVVFSAKSDFDPYQGRRPTYLAFVVEYHLYDQYGNQLSRSSNNVGRDPTGVLIHTLSYRIVPVGMDGAKGTVAHSENPLSMQMSRDGLITFGLDTRTSAGQMTSNFTTSNAEDYFVVITPVIATQTSAGVVSVQYAQPEVVWIVKDADDFGKPDVYGSDYQTAFRETAFREIDLTASDREEFEEISIDAARDEFRTYFTIWEYDSNDEFLNADEDELTIGQFESLLREGIGIDEFKVLLYWANSSRSSSFQVLR